MDRADEIETCPERGSPPLDHPGVWEIECVETERKFVSLSIDLVTCFEKSECMGRSASAWSILNVIGYRISLSDDLAVRHVGMYIFGHLVNASATYGVTIYFIS